MFNKDNKDNKDKPREQAKSEMSTLNKGQLTLNKGQSTWPKGQSTFPGSTATKKPAETETDWAKLVKGNKNSSEYQSANGFILDDPKFQDLTLEAIMVLDHIKNGHFKADYKIGEPKKAAKPVGHGQNASKLGQGNGTFNSFTNKEKLINFADFTYPESDIVPPETAKKYFLPRVYSTHQERLNFINKKEFEQEENNERLVNYPTLFERRVRETEVPINIPHQKALNVSTNQHLFQENPIDGNKVRDSINPLIKEKINVNHSRILRDGIGAVEIFNFEYDIYDYNFVLKECYINLDSIKNLQFYAIVTMYSVWPKDSRGIRTSSSVDLKKYDEELKEFCNSLSLEYISYIPEMGIFTFSLKGARQKTCFSLP